MTHVIVFGASGMLGAYVENYLKQRGFSVTPMHRYDVITEVNRLRDRLEAVGGGSAWVINCAGVIKPQVATQGVAETIRVNALFPHILSEACGSLGWYLLHITTDCVFSGNKGGYVESSPHDELDIYGRTKSLGEPEGCLVVRTSIIGEERLHQRSLIEWAKSQKGKEVRGFTNHTWNGVTCLQFAKIAEQLMNSSLRWQGVRHVFSPTEVNKLELLQLIDRAFDLHLVIQPFETAAPCFRTLNSEHREVVTELNIPPLAQQLSDLRAFKWE